MANKFITALFGDYSKKEVKRLGKTKQKVLDLEEKYQAMDDKELTAQTARLKNPVGGRRDFGRHFAGRICRLP